MEIIALKKCNPTTKDSGRGRGVRTETKDRRQEKQTDRHTERRLKGRESQTDRETDERDGRTDRGGKEASL